MADSSSRNPESSRLHATAASGAAGRSGKPYCFSFRSQRSALRFTGSCPQSTSESLCGWLLRSIARTMRSVLCAVGQWVTAAVRLRASRSSLTSTLLPPLLDTVLQDVATTGEVAMVWWTVCSAATATCRRRCRHGGRSAGECQATSAGGSHHHLLFADSEGHGRVPARGRYCPRLLKRCGGGGWPPGPRILSLQCRRQRQPSQRQVRRLRSGGLSSVRRRARPVCPGRRDGRPRELAGRGRPRRVRPPR